MRIRSKGLALLFGASVLSGGPVAAQVVTGTLGEPERDDDDPRQPDSRADAAIRRRDQGDPRGIEDLVAAADHAA